MTPNGPVIMLVASMAILQFVLITVDYEFTNMSQNTQNEKLDAIEKELLIVEKKLNMTQNKVLSISYGGQVMYCDKYGCITTKEPPMITEQVCNQNYCSNIQFNTTMYLRDALEP